MSISKNEVSWREDSCLKVVVRQQKLRHLYSMITLLTLHTATQQPYNPNFSQSNLRGKKTQRRNKQTTSTIKFATQSHTTNGFLPRPARCGAQLVASLHTVEATGSGGAFYRWSVSEERRGFWSTGSAPPLCWQSQPGAFFGFCAFHTIGSTST